MNQLCRPYTQDKPFQDIFFFRYGIKFFRGYNKCVAHALFVDLFLWRIKSRLVCHVSNIDSLILV